ncbi:MAG TPA: NYN domain-containing protein [Gemmataceae bacterium]|nr:NYN domain-containing protein [Gemmataceae bacterium]
MAKKCVVLVDNSNVFIEGRKYSARLKGVTRGNPADKHPSDPSWRLDFGSLLTHLANGRVIDAAILVGSRPPKNDSVWEAAKHHGFTVIVHDRGIDGKEKAIDTELVTQGTEIICTATEPMILVIASGDRDFIPLVRVAQRRTWDVEMAAFSSAFDPNGQMATEVDLVRPLDPAFASIGHHDFEWPIP